MDATRMLAEARGFFTRGEAIGLGYDDDDLAAGLRHGVLVRIRRGTYSFRDLWASYDELGKYRVLCRAVLHVLGPRVALSHTSGAILHGIACWGADLRTVHVTRLDGGAGRVEAGVEHHVGRAVAEDVREIDGMAVLAADRCAIEAASGGTNEQALVVLDSFLFHKLGSHDDLMRRFEEMAHWRDTRKLHIPVRMADAGAESPGESRGRWLFRQWHLPAPVLQYPIHDADGRLVGRTDWAWPEYGLLGEFDGKVKYGRLLLPGQDPGEVVFFEKVREDEMRELTGFGMVRLIWSDYDRRRATDARIRRLMRIAA